MSKVVEITGENFRKMQLVQLDMIKELDRVCRKHDIGYVLVSGTLLGAVRHKGYIPWDDDGDVAMLREDYEKFKALSNEMDPSICYFQDHDTDPEYRWGYGKLRRTGTKYIRVGQEHLKCKTGIFVDVFPLDDVPLSFIGQVFQDVHCYILRKILWSEVGKYSAKGFKKLWFSLLSKIPAQTVFDWLDVYVRKSNNSTPNRVRALTLPAAGKYYYKSEHLKDRYGMPKEWFLERAEYEFEGEHFLGTKDYDAILKHYYRDYMTLPPEDKRTPHAPCIEIQFPDEKGESDDRTDS
ncbi:MAG: LicD family protein [Lachnospiraceae bacterium]|nr:LicD family protein [Lachnospiraceae bacterium]